MMIATSILCYIGGVSGANSNGDWMMEIWRCKKCTSFNDPAKAPDMFRCYQWQCGEPRPAGRPEAPWKCKCSTVNKPHLAFPGYENNCYGCHRDRKESEVLVKPSAPELPAQPSAPEFPSYHAEKGQPFKDHHDISPPLQELWNDTNHQVQPKASAPPAPSVSGMQVPSAPLEADEPFYGIGSHMNNHGSAYEEKVPNALPNTTSKAPERGHAVEDKWTLVTFNQHQRSNGSEVLGKKVKIDFSGPNPFPCETEIVYAYSDGTSQLGGVEKGYIQYKSDKWYHMRDIHDVREPCSYAVNEIYTQKYMEWLQSRPSAIPYMKDSDMDVVRERQNKNPQLVDFFSQICALNAIPLQLNRSGKKYNCFIGFKRRKGTEDLCFNCMITDGRNLVENQKGTVSRVHDPENSSWLSNAFKWGKFTGSAEQLNTDENRQLLNKAYKTWKKTNPKSGKK